LRLKLAARAVATIKTIYLVWRTTPAPHICGKSASVGGGATKKRDASNKYSLAALSFVRMNEPAQSGNHAGSPQRKPEGNRYG
jgi:hypothetical protein